MHNLKKLINNENLLEKKYTSIMKYEHKCHSRHSCKNFFLSCLSLTKNKQIYYNCVQCSATVGCSVYQSEESAEIENT